MAPVRPFAIAVLAAVVVGVTGLVLAGSSGTVPPATSAADEPGRILGTPGGEAPSVAGTSGWWTPDRPGGSIADQSLPDGEQPRVPGEGGADDDVDVDPGDAADGDAPGSGDAEPLSEAAVAGEVFDTGPAADAQPATRTSEGFDVAAGEVEFGDGPPLSYTVELEPDVGEDLLALTAAVEEALGDPRSWARDQRLRRVEDPAEADIRVLLATPSTVDRLCAEVGLRTMGRYSCWNGTFAALNADRWANGADGFDDLTTYRRYLVNHEFGHGLGYGLVDCPEPGAAAPVMMQQTMGTGACEPNGWPYPDVDGS